MTATNSFSAGTTIESAKVNENFSDLGRLGSAQVTADQGTFTTVVDLTGLSVTVVISSAFATAARKIKISAVAQFKSSVGSDHVRMSIKEGSTVLQFADVLTSPTNGRTSKVYDAVEITPTVGSHTYKLTGERIAGTGNITMAASSTGPAILLVEAI